MNYEHPKNIVPELGRNVHLFTSQNGLRVTYYQRLDVPHFVMFLGIPIEDAADITGLGLPHLAEHIAARYL